MSSALTNIYNSRCFAGSSRFSFTYETELPNGILECEICLISDSINLANIYHLQLHCVDFELMSKVEIHEYFTYFCRKSKILIDL